MLASSKRWLAIMLLGAIPFCAFAQPQVDSPEALSGSESNQGVYVRDSAIALERFALGQRMERLKEWNKAADVFQEILEKYPDRVVQSKVDADNNVYQYKSVTIAVQERVSKWPDDGLRVYKSRYESAAQQILEQSKRDDYAALHKVFSLYFATDSGKTAGLRLMDLYLESGEFAAAAWLGDRMLQWHPGLLVERPAILYRAALAYHLSGDAAKAKQRLDELKTKHADATGKVRGVDVTLAQSLEKELSAAAAPKAVASTADTWPIFMGDQSRSRVSTGNGRPGAKAFVSVEISRTPRSANRGSDGGGASGPPRIDRVVDQSRSDSGSSASDATHLLGVMPVVDHNEMYFQDGQRIYAVSLESGLPLPGWLSTYPGEKSGRYLASTSLPRQGQTTITLTDNHVLAVMGQPISAALANALAPMGGLVIRGRGGEVEGLPPERETRLVCLDRTSGKEKWVATARQNLPNEGTLRSLSLSGSPLVVGDNVYVIGRGGKGVQFEDCYVICFDLSDGKYKWSCYIASANTGGMIMGGDGPQSLGDTVSHLAYASGRLYILTNLGAVAAVDAYAGSIAWLNIYPRDIDPDAMGNNGGRMRIMRSGAPVSNRPWTGNPVMVQDGKVFALPTDGKHVLVYDAGTGAELKQIEFADVDRADSLIGVLGNRVVLASDQYVFCLDWSKYDKVTGTTAAADCVVWKGSKLRQIRGRGFLTHDSVFIPTYERLYRFDLTTGKVVDMYPGPSRRWDDDEGPGNVLVTSDKVIIAGARRVNVYTDLAVATAKLDREIAASPNDPDPRLRYAEIMFISGDTAKAVARVDEAIGLLGGPGSMRPGAGRDRVFNALMTFAMKLSDPKTGTPESNAITRELFDRAASAASSPPQQVNYRIGRAKFEHLVKRYDDEVKLYQDLLTDASLRTVAVSDDDGAGPMPASVLAEARIASVIRTNPQAYAPFEKAAREAMDFAKAKRDAGEFLAIAQRYPNSSQASEAMLAAAESYEAAGNARQATQVLRQVYARYSDGKDRPKLLEALARNYLLLPNHVDVAISRLMQAARPPVEARLTAEMKLPNGKILPPNTSFADAVDAVKQYKLAQVTKALPDFHLPPPPAPGDNAAGRKIKQTAPFLPETAPIDGVDVLVPAQRGYERFDRIVTWSAGSGLSIYDVGHPSPAATTTAIADPPKEMAWLNEGQQLLIWTDNEIALLKTAKLDVIWKSPIKSLPDAEIVALAGGAAGFDGEAGDLQVAADMEGQIIINQRRFRAAQVFIGPNNRVRLRGQQVAIQQLPQQQQPQGGAAAAPPAGEQVLFVRPAGDRIVAATSKGRVFGLDFSDGKPAWQLRFSSDRPVDKLVANDDFAALKITDDNAVQLVAIDAFTGQLIKRWVFNNEPLQSPVNLALSPDGTLVYTLPDRICGKDLNEPAGTSNWEVTGQAPGLPLYANATGDDQLLIEGGRILAVSDNSLTVRVHDLETGRVIRSKSVDGLEIETLLQTGAPLASPVSLHVAGPYIYVLSPKKLMSYDLERRLSGVAPSGQAVPSRLVPSDPQLVDAYIGADHLVVRDDVSWNRGFNANNQPPTQCRLLAYWRGETEPGKESGLLNYDPLIAHPSGIETIQGVDGGFYYLAKDKTLHFLKGARQ